MDRSRKYFRFNLTNIDKVSEQRSLREIGDAVVWIFEKSLPPPHPPPGTDLFVKVKFGEAHFRIISWRLIAAACRTIPDGDVENVEGRLGGGPVVDAINRIHCFPLGNRLEQWSRHVIRAIKPHQITTLRHRVSLRSCVCVCACARAHLRARSLARTLGSIYESLYKCNETVTGGASSITPPLPTPVPFRRRRRSFPRSSSAPHIRLRVT